LSLLEEVVLALKFGSEVRIDRQPWLAKELVLALKKEEA
jgi:hypothetical protein